MEKVINLSSSKFLKLIQFEPCSGVDHANRRLEELIAEGKYH